MAPVPTVQNQGQRSKEGRRSKGSLIERTGLVTKVKYCNTLPDIPFDPKFIRYPFEPNRFVEYKPTTLEKQHKIELHSDHDLGVTIDLINPDTYKIQGKNWLDPADEALLEEDLPTPQDSKRSKQHSINVSWLRRSEYISQEFNRFGVKADKIETRIGAGVKDLFKDDDLYKDRDSQIEAIKKTFQDSKTEITKHYSKPNVYPVDVFSLYPDFKMWQHPSAQVMFDSDPAVKDKGSEEQYDEMSQAMIRGMVDEEGDQFVAYFLPTKETMQKRKQDNENNMDYNPEETYDYKLAREYNWNVKNKASKGYEENYYFVFRESGVYYNELETRVRLSKRRAKGGGGVQSATNAILAVKHRELVEQELAAQEMRKLQLEPLEADEEEDEENAEEDAKEANHEGEDDNEKTNDGTENEEDEQKHQSSESEDEKMEEGSEKEDQNENDDSSSNESSAGEENHQAEENEIFGSGSDISSDSD